MLTTLVGAIITALIGGAYMWVTRSRAAAQAESDKRTLIGRTAYDQGEAAAEDAGLDAEVAAEEAKKRAEAGW